MDDIPGSAREGTSPQPSDSGKAEPRRKHSPEEIRRFQDNMARAIDRLTHELETRTKSPTEIARERWANAPRQTEAEMREILETELSHYATLPDDWDGYSSKAASPDALRDARKFLSLRPADIPLPYPSLGSDGVVGLRWDSANLSVSITFEGDGKFYFLVLRYSEGKKTGRDWAEDCPVDSGWPEALTGPLRELMAGTDTEDDQPVVPEAAVTPGKRGRMTSAADRARVLREIDEARRRGATVAQACPPAGISARTFWRWKGAEGGEDRRREGATKRAKDRRLGDDVRAEVLRVCALPEHAHRSLAQIVAELAREGRRLCSASTMRRILLEAGVVRRRTSTRPSSPDRARPGTDRLDTPDGRT